MNIINSNNQINRIFLTPNITNIDDVTKLDFTNEATGDILEYIGDFGISSHYFYCDLNLNNIGLQDDSYYILRAFNVDKIVYIGKVFVSKYNGLESSLSNGFTENVSDNNFITLD